MNGPLPGDVAAGHRVYTSRFLSIYDLIVLGWFSRTAWRCPASVLTSHYDAHVSANHLDVGVGTGYFLDHCTFPTSRPRLAVLDVNPACLAAASQRVSRFQPETHVANVLEPIASQLGRDIAGFDSIAMTYSAQCLLGDMTAKAMVFEHLLALSNPGATDFGTTLLAILWVPNTQSWLVKRRFCIVDEAVASGRFYGARVAPFSERWLGPEWWPLVE